MNKGKKLLLLLGIIPVLFAGYIQADKVQYKPVTTALTSELKSEDCSFLEEITYCPIEDNPEYCYLNGGFVANAPKPKPVEVAPPVEDKKNEVVAEQPQVKASKKNVIISRGGSVPTGSAISMSDEERYWLEKLVEAEAADEPYLGKMAVANVVANRVLDNEFPNTVNGVIREKGQYSPWSDGSIYKRTASADTKRAVSAIFDRGERVLPKDAMYFVATYVKGNWIDKTRRYITTIGGHGFYSKYSK